uniref:Glucokinase regulator n=1 Tax=Hippocampus comes TaxID=109280 RepID=A0A3Q2YZ76_HIPCM
MNLELLGKRGRGRPKRRLRHEVRGRHKDYEPSLPVSEKSNPLTWDIDQASPSRIVRMLQNCDAEMFREETGSTYLVSQVMTQCTVAPFHLVNICGNANIVCEGKKRVLFIGISCGLSAPFVAGQLEFCLRHPEVFTPVLIGFNPAHQARNEPTPNCTFTFLSVVQRMQVLANSRKAFLINPSVGPEAISGSSRMKGGSATKMLLEVILCSAHAAAFSQISGCIQDVCLCYSLLCKKRVCYLGWGSLAVLGLIDASECEPTFGAGEQQCHTQGPQFCIAHEDFLLHVLPTLDDQDTVILIYTQTDNITEVMNVAYRVREKMSNLHAIYHQADGDDDDQVGLPPYIILHLLTYSIHSIQYPLQHMWELSTKLVLNAVSTGAHILKGKVFHNYMIDVQVTNSKLYRRATRLIQVSNYKMTVAWCTSSLSCEQVVPLTLVSLLTGCSLEDASSRLDLQPIIRKAVEALMRHFSVHKFVPMKMRTLILSSIFLAYLYAPQMDLMFLIVFFFSVLYPHTLKHLNGYSDLLCFSADHYHTDVLYCIVYDSLVAFTHSVFVMLFSF